MTVKKKNYRIEKICRECGEIFIEELTRGRKRVYCSDICTRKADNKRRLKPKYLKTCKECEINFDTCREDQNYCSHLCYTTSRRTLKGLTYACIICGKVYEKSYKTQECCSLKCSHIKGGNTLRVHPDKLKHRRKAEAIRRRTDIAFVLKNRVRSLMYSSLRKRKNGRKWQELIGYSIEDLRHHIEKQFTNGMNWYRFLAGEIHIDHVIPVSAFNFKKATDIDFKKCWALKNLQPMWAGENISKNNKLEKPFQPSLAF